MVTTHGIHHVTAIASDPQRNLSFYTGVLGLRLVKRSVNQDDPHTYHLFYADGDGNPGTDLTFFPWPGKPPGTRGVGMAVDIGFAVPSASLSFWSERLRDNGVEVAEESRFDEDVLAFADPDGVPLALHGVDPDDLARPFTPWEDGSVPSEHQLRGFHVARLLVAELEPTARFLTETYGYAASEEEDGWRRFTIEGGGSGGLLDVREAAGEASGSYGPGTVHHVAFRVAGDEEQVAVREAIAAAGRTPTPVIDRFWFRSVYFREPGGVLFEIATDGPGFTVDEDAAELGGKLILPPWLEPQRRDIEDALPELEVGTATFDAQRNTTR